MLKQPAAFIASLSLQVALLVVLCGGGFYPQMSSGPSIRPGAMSSASITSIYFHNDAMADPSIPDHSAAAPPESHHAPQPPRDAKSGREQGANTQTENADGSLGTGEVQGLAPFPGWRMNSAPTSYTVMHHQIKTALPIFTPEPPILQKGVPEFARGKDLVLEVVIDDQGSITQVEVLKAVGYGVESSIMLTLRRWIFIPAKINGIAIASRRQLRFHFSS